MPILDATHGTEYKNLHFEIKEGDIDTAQGIIRGYLSTFNNVDSTKDRVRPGAFRKTLTDALQRKTNKGKKFLWPFLWMHNPDQPIGGVIDAIEDSKGLLITAQLDISTNGAGIPNNPLATATFSGFQYGYVDELSMGYKALQKDYVENGIRDLKEVQLWEASGVTSLFAANNEALVSDVKTKIQELKEQIMNMEQKTGKTISAATAQTLAGHAENLQNLAMQHKAMADIQCKAMMEAASDLQAMLGTPNNPDGTEDATKSNPEPLSQALKTDEPDKSTQEDIDIAQFEAFLKSQINH